MAVVAVWFCAGGIAGGTLGDLSPAAWVSGFHAASSAGEIPALVISSEVDVPDSHQHCHGGRFLEFVVLCLTDFIDDPAKIKGRSK